MRVIKKATVRKNEILDAAAILFEEKGFDNTSTNDILEAVGIARGTLYHHFKSKEDVMDSLIVRQMEQVLSAARQAAEDKSASIEERFLHTVMALHISEKGRIMTDHLHKPQNALMQQKINQITMREVPPILAGIVEDGIREGIFETAHPLSCMEIAVVYLKTVLDDGIFELSDQESAARIEAFTYQLERMLGVSRGRLAFFTKLFRKEEEL